MFAENCVKMNEIVPTEGRTSLVPLDPQILVHWCSLFRAQGTVVNQYFSHKLTVTVTVVFFLFCIRLGELVELGEFN